MMSVFDLLYQDKEVGLLLLSWDTITLFVAVEFSARFQPLPVPDTSKPSCVYDVSMASLWISYTKKVCFIWEDCGFRFDCGCLV